MWLFDHRTLVLYLVQSPWVRCWLHELTTAAAGHFYWPLRAVELYIGTGSIAQYYFHFGGGLVPKTPSPLALINKKCSFFSWELQKACHKWFDTIKRFWMDKFHGKRLCEILALNIPLNKFSLFLKNLLHLCMLV